MKLSIIGAGNVGSSTAFASLYKLTKLDQLALVDVVPGLAEGQAMDLTHACFVIGRKVRIEGSADFSIIRGSDIVVNTAGIGRKPGMTRDDLLHTNAEILRSTTEQVRTYAPDCVFIQVANPLDVMTYLAYKELGFPRERVIGAGCLLDTARLHSLGFGGTIMGEHGESMFVAGARLTEDDMKKVRDIGAEVIKRKQATMFGPAACITYKLGCIIHDLNEIVPCSCVLDGEYGLKGLAIGVQAKLGKRGITEITEQKLTEHEKKMLYASAERIRENIRLVT